jgi:DNA-binding PadR family transcriptional regulator
MASPRNDILQGTLALLVLRTLESAGPLHGYAIMTHIHDVSAHGAGWLAAFHVGHH